MFWKNKSLSRNVYQNNENRVQMRYKEAYENTTAPNSA